MVDGQHASAALHTRNHVGQPHPPRVVRRRGAKPRLQDQAVHGLGFTVRVRAQQTLRACARADCQWVKARAVIAYADDQILALVPKAKRYGPHRRLATQGALVRVLDAMLDGVAQQMLDQSDELCGQGAVDLTVVAGDHQRHTFPKGRGGGLDALLETRCQTRDRDAA